MGLFSNLLSMTGGGKMMAAQNALAAKHLLDEMAKANDYHLGEVFEMMSRILISGGMPIPQAASFAKSHDRKAFFGVAAIAFYNLHQPPPFRGLFFRDEWNSISNPLVALANADKEILMVQREIMQKFGIMVTLEKS